MKIIADLQIHSKHARATSNALSIDNLEKYAKIKGLNLLGVGDFQHPIHRKEINEKLTEDDNGILWTKNKFPFIWQTEISLMYAQDGRRAIHLLIFAPNTKTADQITSYLGSKGRLDYDGRPIFGIPSPQLVKDLKAISDDIEIIPAHCMTPYFGLFGSKSGFNSIKDCFGDQTKHIYAIESGISADPQMLWRFKESVNIVSFSDAHSFWPWRLGREATIFDIPKLTYNNIINAIRTTEGLSSTIETPPSYGRYHWDGHRNCNFSCPPSKSKQINKTCPICKKPLTIGVDYRVEELAKEDHNYTPENQIPFHTIIPLHELISFDVSTSMSSKKSWGIYNNLIELFNNEFNILLNVSKLDLLKNNVNDTLANLIMDNRNNKLTINPGFDGEYGKITLKESQSKLF